MPEQAAPPPVDTLLLWWLVALLSTPDPAPSGASEGMPGIPVRGSHVTDIRVTVRKAPPGAPTTPGARSSLQPLEAALLEHLHGLGIAAYEQVIAQLLQSVGYEQVQVLRNAARPRRSHRGRNRHGGVDIVATGRAGLASDAVLVQVKQYSRPVSRRFVDELRGALLRTESRHALLITTSHFAPAALRAAREDHVAPVHLMNGQRLCRLLRQNGVGVRQDRDGRTVLDKAYFRRLGEAHPPPTLPAPQNHRRDGEEPKPALRNGGVSPLSFGTRVNAKKKGREPKSREQRGQAQKGREAAGRCSPSRKSNFRKSNRRTSPAAQAGAGQEDASQARVRREDASQPAKRQTATKPEKGGGMMGRTHVLVGIASLWLLEPTGIVTLETLPPLILCASLGALLPDLDAADSMIRRLSVAGITPLAPVARALHRSLGHRGLLHSLAGLGLFAGLGALPVALWLGWPYGAALALGYASHVAADAATKSGVPLLYPRRKRYRLLPRGWRLTTGSMAEEALLPLLALAVLLLVFRHLYPVP